MDELEAKAEKKAEEWASKMFAIYGNPEKVVFTKGSLAHLIKICLTYKL